MDIYNCYICNQSAVPIYMLVIKHTFLFYAYFLMPVYFNLGHKVCMAC